ncbi:MAG: hypothetical protein ACI4Q4_04950 [Oscillospiraceae bacterium]
MKYTITRIIEPDFGCEGLPENEERMDRVYLRAEDGSERIIAVPDALLYELNLYEGSECLLDDKGEISAV